MLNYLSPHTASEHIMNPETSAKPTGAESRLDDNEMDTDGQLESVPVHSSSHLSSVHNHSNSSSEELSRLASPLIDNDLDFNLRSNTDLTDRGREESRGVPQAEKSRAFPHADESRGVLHAEESRGILHAPSASELARRRMSSPESNVRHGMEDKVQGLLDSQGHINGDYERDGIRDSRFVQEQLSALRNTDGSNSYVNLSPGTMPRDQEANAYRMNREHENHYPYVPKSDNISSSTNLRRFKSGSVHDNNETHDGLDLDETDIKKRFSAASSQGSQAALGVEFTNQPSGIGLRFH